MKVVRLVSALSLVLGQFVIAIGTAEAGGALPSGGTVTAGSATIGASGANGLIISQSSGKAIIDWSSFSIGGGNSVNFQNGTGATLNRVTGGSVSSLDGLLSATGSVYLVNPNGVIIGKDGVVRVGGSFVASTLDVGNAAFLAGSDLTFKGTSNATVVNLGKVGALGGDVALIAARVENGGAIEAPNGTAGLLGGYEVLMRDASLADGKFVVKLGGPGTGVTNTGSIAAAAAELRANGGNVLGLAGNTGGIIRATGVAKKGGRVFLTAPGGSVKLTGKVIARKAPAGGKAAGGEVYLNADLVEQAGTIDVAGQGGKGGTAIVTGKSVTLDPGALIDASGLTGGTVLVGGDRAGGATPSLKLVSEAVANAETVAIAGGATIDASGTAGAGGNVVVWSEGATDYAGRIVATGVSGDGGFAEVSSHGMLAFAGTADLTSAEGKAGTLLLDPYDVTISSAPTSLITLVSGSYSPTGTSNLNVADLANALASANVIVTTGGAGSPGSDAGDITVANSISWSSANSLTLDAYRSIIVNAGVTIASLGGGDLNLHADNSGQGIGTVSFGSGAQVTTSGGTDVSIFYNPSSFPTPTDYSPYVSLASGATLTSYMLVNDVTQLQAINQNLNGNYALGRDIDASATATWNLNGSGGYYGFVPLGTNGTGAILNGGNGFQGRLDGQGHVVRGLTINRPTANYVGLIGYFGNLAPVAIKDIGLEDIHIVGQYYVGGLIGLAGTSGTISGAFATGVLGGISYAGGLVGYTGGVPISNSWTDVALSASSTFNIVEIGGLVGYSGGPIMNSWATGDVVVTNTCSGCSTYYIGGLAGFSAGAVTRSWASGNVKANGTSAELHDVGGLLGSAYSVLDSYATGNVSTDNPANAWNFGGLIGLAHGEVSRAYALGSVTGGQYVGGLIGWLDGGAGGKVSYAYSTGAVSGTVNVGGLIGYSAQSGSAILVNSSYWDEETSGQPINGIGGYAGGNPGTPTGLTTAQARTAASYVGWDFTNDWYMIDGQTRPFLRAEWSSTITNAHQLQLMSMNPSASYTIANDIDASATAGIDAAGMWTSAGFVPVGTDGAGGILNGGYGFQGRLDGQGHVVSGLTIHRPTASYVGLIGYFGYLAPVAIKNIGLEDIAIVGQNFVGGLIGQAGASGTISGAFATGTLSGTGYAGGLVGHTGGTQISSSWTDVAISASTNTYYVEYIGGLAGYSGGPITNSWAKGDVVVNNSCSACESTYIGGLAGFSTGAVTRSWASGNVAVNGTSAKEDVGGLLGLAYSVFDSYATGNVSTNNPANAAYFGGLVGYARREVSRAYALGSVTGGQYVGGLIGYLDGTVGGKVSYAYSTGAVSGTGNVGGLIGYVVDPPGDILVNSSYWDKETSGQPINGVGGFNGVDPGTPTGLTTAQFQDTQGFMALAGAEGWNFQTTWAPSSAGYYPELYALSPVIWVDANDVTRTYGDTTPALTVAGQYGGAASYVFGPGGDSLSFTPTLASADGYNAGTHAITGESSATSTKGIDYRVVYSGTLTINPAIITVVVSATADDKTYDGTTAATAHLSYNYTSGDDLTVTYNSAYFDDPNVGQNKTVTVGGLDLSGADAGNYTLAGVTFVTASASIIARDVYVTGGTISRAYGDNNPATTDQFTVADADATSGLVDGDLIGQVEVTSPTATATSNVGNYVWTPGGAQFSSGSSGNYAVHYADGVLDVLQRSITVTAEAGQAKIYGTDDPTLTYTYSSLGAGAALTGSLSRDAGENVGNHAITEGTLATSNPNYDIAFTGADFSITPRDLYVTGGIISRAYGDDNPAATDQFTVADADATSGLVDGDLIGQVAVTNPTATATSDVGGYAWTPGAAQFSSGLPSNYAVHYADGVLDVLQRAITVTADAQSKTYGDADPLLGWQVTAGSLVDSDGFIGSLSRDPGENVGAYAVTQGTLALSSNYALTYVGNDLTIGQRGITVTADGQSKAYGDADPPFTWQVTAGNLVHGDLFSGALSRNPGENVGAYTIKQGTLALSSNYALTYVPGTLTIVAGSVIPPPSPPALPPYQSALAQLLLLAGWWNGDFPDGVGSGPASGPPDWGMRCKEDVPECVGFPYPGNGDFSPFVTYH